jgi:hypothetical protein
MAPRPRWAGDISEDLRARYSAFIGDVERAGNLDRSRDWSELALRLSADLHVAAQDLGCSRAHEFSDDVFWADWASAVVAFFAAGKRSTAFEERRSGMAYYQRFSRWTHAVELLDQLAPIQAPEGN